MAADKGNKKPKVKLEDLRFYFDGVETERVDAAGWGRRSAEVLVLREKLLKMPAPAFEAAIKTMKNVIADKPAADDPVEASKARRAAAAKLFEQVQGDR